LSNARRSSVVNAVRRYRFFPLDFDEDAAAAFTGALRPARIPGDILEALRKQ